MQPVHPLFAGAAALLLQVCLAAAIVFFAMLIDLASGLYKARLRGEMRSSWGLKRSVQKFILYEGAILIGGCIDLLCLTSHIGALFGCATLDGIALFAAMIAILLCIVELWSLREKADEKTRKDINRASALITSLLDKKQLAEALTAALASSIQHPAPSPEGEAPSHSDTPPTA